MKQPPIFEYLQIDYYSATPKYLQLANSIIRAINEGKLKKNDTLPSINELSFEFEISRDTAEKGYKHLKNIGVLGSVPGKGYFVKNAELNQTLKIFLLFNKLSPHKKIIYDALANTLGDMAAIDFYIYNNDFALFKKLIENPKEDYTHYVIIPHFMDGGENAVDVINTIPKERLILLDKLIPGVTGNFGAVYESFEKDIYHSLEQALEPLAKYHTIKIIFPEYTYYPQEILKGFSRFCHQYAFNYKVVHDISIEPIKEGEVFINLMDNDLVTLIEKILVTKLRVGKHVGVISYNETPLKKIILNGITTISTDFQLMGEKTAELILNQSSEHVPIPFHLTQRASL
ncbi:GntR family transcriptional regulator [Parasegetibacter sp. NRK P23]|uniref:GntR family transcriptional regulator n=1 Tax=Parasegetibacter sp. NRK P23 TaxID=2942999 RepID=UPI002044611B|nr:GntR family transcriptional regulator [Parasegetibacter sp. NRK P23]MCM5529835.1 GntR family transcriptional regulator [Parasegetibacter sp. NRK P23]